MNERVDLYKIHGWKQVFSNFWWHFFIRWWCWEAWFQSDYHSCFSTLRIFSFSWYYENFSLIVLASQRVLSFERPYPSVRNIPWFVSLIISLPFFPFLSLWYTCSTGIGLPILIDHDVYWCSILYVSFASILLSFLGL